MNWTSLAVGVFFLLFGLLKSLDLLNVKPADVNLLTLGHVALVLVAFAAGVLVLMRGVKTTP